MRLALTFERLDPSRGGAETYVADLCRFLVAEGHAVDLYANSWRPEALPSAVRCVYVASTGWLRRERIWSFASNAADALRNESYDCTIGLINTWNQDILIPQGGVHEASLEANAQRFPSGWRRTLYRVLKRANPRFRMYRTIERRQYDPARGTRIVAVSRMVRGHLERYHNVPRDRIRVIPNAIDPDRLAVADPAVSRARFRSRLGLRDDDLLALFVAHNFWLKGLEPLLRALAARRRNDPLGRPMVLAVCGGGRLGPVRRLVRRLGLGDTVRLVGFVPDIRDGFHASDFFVLPTYYDPCALVVFEALACGLPVITTQCNGAGELITEGREGFVIARPDAQDRLIAALQAMTDDATRRAMSALALTLGRAQSFPTHLRRLLELCEEVAESKRKGLTPHRRTVFASSP